MTSYNQTGIQTLTVSTVAVGLTLPSDASAKRPTHAMIYVGNHPIRYRADGTDPTSTVGMYVPAGAYIKAIDGWTNFSGWLDRVRFIRDTSATDDATLDVEYVN